MQFQTVDHRVIENYQASLALIDPLHLFHGSLYACSKKKSGKFCEKLHVKRNITISIRLFLFPFERSAILISKSKKFWIRQRNTRLTDEN